MKTIINQDGKVPLFNRDGVKTAIQVVQQEVKQIEVVLSEGGIRVVDIDLTPLNLTENSNFIVSTHINYVDNLGAPIFGRTFMRFNNISTNDYSAATTGGQNALSNEATDSNFTSHYLTSNLIRGEIIGNYFSFRFDGTTRRINSTMWTLRNNNIQQINSILFYAALVTQFYKAGTKFIITKLT